MKPSAIAIALASLVAVSVPAWAADPVDLRDKQGVVDPKDLKKSDPKEGSLKTREPPAPVQEKEPDVPRERVDVSGQDTKNYPPSQHLIDQYKDKGNP